MLSKLLKSSRRIAYCSYFTVFEIIHLALVVLCSAKSLQAPLANSSFERTNHPHIVSSSLHSCPSLRLTVVQGTTLAPPPTLSAKNVLERVSCSTVSARVHLELTAVRFYRTLHLRVQGFTALCVSPLAHTAIREPEAPREVEGGGETVC